MSVRPDILESWYNIVPMLKDIDELKADIKSYKGIASDSRLVKPGFIFVAIRGLMSDGHDFIPQAIKNGASLVIGEDPTTRFAGSGLNGVDYIKVEDSRQALGELASEFYGDPSQKLKIIGVTGTKGKTTTCHLIYHILTRLGKKVGLLSSISVPGLHVTTPDPVFLHKSLKEFVDKGYEYAVIEVSSHGIDQKRIAGVKFDVTVLTNIAPEHLDYHKTFKEYKRVKMQFYNSGKIKIMSPKSTDLKVLPGEFNNINAETAVRVAEKLGIRRMEAIKTLGFFKLPEGRLEEIKNNLGFRIFIDFAHTPDSLSAVLTYLRTQTKGRLIAVFGCAGERDTRKRFQMGKLSIKLADLSVFTAEDPRSEKISSILSKMSDGAKKARGIENKNFFRISERGEGIVFALSQAKNGDVIAILGKGYEKSMAYEGCEHPWSDIEVVEDYLNRDKNISVIVLAAGKGTRMKSQTPKILHKICGRPMISYTLENLRRSLVGEIVAVVSYRKNLVLREIQGDVKIAVQKNSKGGTADAAKVGFDKVSKDTKVLIVINGDDSAFYTSDTIKKIIEIHLERQRKLTFVSLMKEDPTGLGRVIRRKDGLIAKIVEEKEATEDEREIKEINDGLYVFDKNWFSQNIKKIQKRPQGEFYLVDLIKIAIDQKDRMATYTLPNDDEWQGVNTPEQLVEANKKMASRLISND
jgi:UDP-N-acetylmuramoyl-L-alanyl-D-glutamate--2,6-diaminopimelate ligase